MDNVNARSVGEWLRTTRESRGLSLDDAANVTRIGKNYLQDMEEDQFDRLPSAAYAKGFVRLYAGYLGIPADEAVAAYERQLAGPEIVREEQAPPPKVHGKVKIPAAPWGKWGIPLALLVVILAFALFPGEKREPVPSTPPPTVEKPVQPLPAAIQQRHSSAVQVAPVPPSPAESPSPEPVMKNEENSQGIVLRLKVIQDSSLQMTIDGAVSQQYDLKAGDLIEWKGEKMFALELGNAGGVEAELNGAPLRSFGGVGKPARLVIRADGVHPE